MFTTAVAGSLFIYADAVLRRASGAHWLLPVGAPAGSRRWPGWWRPSRASRSRSPTACGCRRTARMPGDVLELAGAALWAATTLVIKARGAGHQPSHQTLFYQLGGLGGASSHALALATGEAGVTRLTGAVVAAVLYQIVAVAFASYLAWFWMLTRYPASYAPRVHVLDALFGLVAGLAPAGRAGDAWALCHRDGLRRGRDLSCVNRPAGRRAGLRGDRPAPY